MSLALMTVRYCFACKTPDCKELFFIEKGYHTVSSQDAQQRLKAFSLLVEPRTITCRKCKQEAEYQQKDVGAYVLE